MLQQLGPLLIAAELPRASSSRRDLLGGRQLRFLLGEVWIALIISKKVLLFISLKFSF